MSYEEDEEIQANNRVRDCAEREMESDGRIIDGLRAELSTFRKLVSDRDRRIKELRDVLEYIIATTNNEEGVMKSFQNRVGHIRFIAMKALSKPAKTEEKS